MIMRGYSYIILFILFSVIHCQHTTSQRFSVVPQPTSSGIVCIQMLCPTEVASASCPPSCNSCSYVPDPCCPQVTTAVCNSDHSSSVAPSTVASSSSTSSSSSSNTASVSSVSSQTPLPSGSTSSPSPSVSPNVALYLQPSAYFMSISLIILCSMLT